MPKVSILIPAYRPQYLDASVASALAQTVTDFELLIGDDSPGDDVQSVLEKWSDPRIKYTRNPNRGQPGANRDMLIAQASGEYIKFLFDDDLLLPESLAMLLSLMEQTGGKLAFHANYDIDTIGRSRPGMTVIPVDAAASLTRDQFFETAIKSGRNFIGGPVNIMIHTATLASIANPFGLDSDRMRFLSDMALYTNFVDRGHILVGLGRRLSAYRWHDQQNSGQLSPIHVAGIFEWELLARWATDRWQLDPAMGTAIIEAFQVNYQEHLALYPALQRFIELGAQPDASGSLYTPAFREVLEAAWESVDRASNLTRTTAS